MGYALLFSGQGSQHPAMFPWLEAARPAQPGLQLLADAIGGDWRGLLASTGGACSNRIAQPLITSTALAAWAAVQALLPQPPDVVAGYSVGELAAFAAAGVLAAPEAIALARLRAEVMDRAVAGRATGLVAISGLSASAVLLACPALECAIRTDAESNVFGGAVAALVDAQRLFGAVAHVRKLCVTVASHTSWMRPAVADFSRALQAAAHLAPAQCPVVTNATGAASRDPVELGAALCEQIAATVRWDHCMASVAERRPACVLEVGGGQALARMWLARYPEIPARSLDEFRTAQGAAAWVDRNLQAGALSAQ